VSIKWLKKIDTYNNEWEIKRFSRNFNSTKIDNKRTYTYKDIKGSLFPRCHAAHEIFVTFFIQSWDPQMLESIFLRTTRPKEHIGFTANINATIIPEKTWFSSIQFNSAWKVSIPSYKLRQFVLHACHTNKARTHLSFFRDDCGVNISCRPHVFQVYLS
jgi:hypothetical protein